MEFSEQVITDIEKKVELREVEFDHPAMQIAMPLVVEHKGELKGFGTAFAVAPGLAITAAHNVNPSRWGEGDNDKASIWLAAYQIIEENLYKWDVDAIYASITSDIAFLRFRRPSWWGDGPGQIKPRYARLNFNPPRPGDEIRLFGFPETELKDGILIIKPSESTAIVESIDRGDSASDKPDWHVKLKGQIIGGMSGGPCFDGNWDVVGVNSSGWSFLYEAYMALLWPALNIEIDLFKTGAFPAINLFNDGAAKGLGYRRVHVASNGQTLFSTIDPDDLIPLKLIGHAENLEHSLNFAAMNAQNALFELRSYLNNIIGQPDTLDNNKLHRILRVFFWELDSAIRISLELTALRVGIHIDNFVDWEQLVTQWRTRQPKPEVLDEIAKLGFAWYGVDIFEIQTYAELCRSGAIYLLSVNSKDSVLAVMLNMCRRGGQQVELPDGLDRFYEAARHFVQRLLSINMTE